MQSYDKPFNILKKWRSRKPTRVGKILIQRLWQFTGINAKNVKHLSKKTVLQVTQVVQVVISMNGKNLPKLAIQIINVKSVEL